MRKRAEQRQSARVLFLPSSSTAFPFSGHRSSSSATVVPHTVLHSLKKERIVVQIPQRIRHRKVEMSQRIGTRLFISRLSFFTTEEHLKTLFSPFGVVKEAKLVVDARTERPKGFGFVSYESEIEAEKAVKAMNGRIVDGRLIFVEPAKEK